MLLFFSCEKAYVLEEDTTSEATGNGQMIVKTAAHVAGEASGNDYVSYPVSVYVMDEDGKCVSLNQISSSDDEMKIDLEAGNYDVYAVAGTENYNLPAAGNATKTSVIELKSGADHGDLMTAYNSVVMTKGEKNTLTLQMVRRVMQVQSITLNNIPEDVTAVQFTMSPFYKSLQLDGSYTDGSASYTFDLVKEGKTWRSEASRYMLEAQNYVTLKVSLTRADGVTSYSYASKEQLSANYKVNITGNFVNEDGISLSGTILGTDWAGTVSMDFDLDETNVSKPGIGDTEEPEVLHGGAPAQGTLYKGCFVLKTESSGNSTTVTLVTPSEMNKIKVSSSTVEENVINSIIENTDYALTQITVDGISGWRLPYEDEVAYVDAHIDEINEQIEDLGNTGITSFELKRSGYACGYFFKASDGNVYVYELGGGGIVKKPGSGRATYKVRGFATLTFTE